MNFPQIQIHTTKAILGLHMEKPIQHIEQPKADLSIEQKPATLTIDSQPARLTIDQSKAWRDMGLLDPFDSTRKFAEEGREALLEGIARRAQEGDQLMKIENRGNAIAAMAAEKGFHPYKQLGITFIPSVHSVDIGYQPSYLDMKIDANKPIIKANVNRPIHEYKPGNVSAYMIQYPTIKMDVKY
ncbi:MULTISPECIES: DUF6470 family protein [Geobacillus]|uniref:Uncharacterized protein n=1 Tax=Geobacillus subterraneus TaxID=129338 RepID=A0A679FNS7_9BACL|nr:MULTISPECIES: DUF6470 family protein [Geobacillus]KYD25374.1 hypothetical protein B4113_1781 [Geobacillus sp. B4113_201601]NNV07379.1 hypothetical protein [Geobacillus sp. MMMUD3]TWG31887.1 hypothetical protein GC56T2_3144 [Geobacillus sp. C56-T2]BBW97640.1 hypothetical protein GsuE55_24730 [Geobacillus subterraneus]